MTDSQARPLASGERLSRCPLCESADITLNLRPNLYRCGDCRLHFCNPRPSQGDILASYDRGETFASWQGELAVRAFLWLKRLARVRESCASGSLLDVGTGDGYFLQFASKHYSVSATELSRAGVELAAARGYEVFHGSVADTVFDDQRFDVITLWHVLEHVPFPGGLLKR